MSFIELLQSEVAKLEADLAHNPTFKKLQAAKALLNAYEDSTGTSIGVRDVAKPVPQPTKKADAPSSAILDAARNLIAGRQYPTSTVDILNAIVAQGVEVGGTVPRNSLSSMLSRSNEFESHGRSGWTLVVPGGHENENADDADPDGDTPSALFERQSDQPAEPPAQGREAVPGGGP